MLKIKFGIADPDKIYLERLGRLFCRKYNNQIEVYSFSESSQIEEAVRSNRINVLAVSPAMDIDRGKIADFCMFSYLVDEKNISGYNDQKVICKYQKADNIYRQILALYSEKLADKVRYRSSEHGRSKVTLFISGYERAGSATLAASFATHLSECGRKTLYLNLKQFGGCEKIFTSSGDGTFTDAIFAAKSKKANMTLRLESIVRQNSSGVFFYESCQNSLDYMEMTSDELRSILDTLAENFGYDDIVIVSDFYLSDKLMLLLEYSDEIVLVSDSRSISEPQMIKRKETIKNIEKRKNISITEKMKIILNKTKYLSSIRSEIPVIATQTILESAGEADLVSRLAGAGIFDKLMTRQEVMG